MRLPLFFFVSLFLCNLLCSCTENYYHCENPFGYLKGNVRKVTDTVYSCSSDGSQQVIQTVEYLFDSINRLTGEKSCYYNQQNSLEENPDTTLRMAKSAKYQYDRDGRKVEIQVKTCLFKDEPRVTTVDQKITQLRKNREKWEMIVSGDGDGKREVFDLDIRYAKDTIYAECTNRKTRETKHSVSLFDNNKNLVEKRETGTDEEQTWALYEYAPDYSLKGIRQKPFPESEQVFITTYRHEEFDNAGNWGKRYEYDGSSNLINVIHRRIEYR